MLLESFRYYWQMAPQLHLPKELSPPVEYSEKAAQTDRKVKI